MTSDPRNPADIEREIEHDREALRRTLDDLQSEFSMDGLSRRVMGSVRRNGADWAQSANAAARANPVALGLAGIGLGWLIFGRGYDPVHQWNDPRRDTGDRPSDGVSSVQRHGRAQHGRLHDAAHRVADQARHLSESFSGSTEGLTDEARHRIDTARRRALDASDKAGRQLRSANRRIGEGFNSEPLLFGALALVGGAALGAMLPGTRREDEMLGDYRDRLFDEAEAIFEEEKGKVSDALATGLDKAKDATLHGAGALTDEPDGTNR